MSNDESVKLRERFRIFRQIVSKLRAIQAIGACLRGHAQPEKQTPRVGVHHEGRFTQGVEQDIVGRLLADAVNAQKLCPQCVRIN